MVRLTALLTAPSRNEPVRDDVLDAPKGHFMLRSNNSCIAIHERGSIYGEANSFAFLREEGGIAFIFEGGGPLAVEGVLGGRSLRNKKLLIIHGLRTLPHPTPSGAPSRKEPRT